MSSQSDDVRDLIEATGEAESVLIHAGDAAARSVSALIERLDAEQAAELTGIHTPLAWVTVANDATAGVSSAEFNAGTYQITMAMRLGQTATKRPLLKLKSHNAGYCTFEVR